MTQSAIDLSDPAIWQNGFPHETFTRLRNSTPLFHHELTPGVAEQVQRDFWMCTKHRHALRIHRDTDAFTATEGPVVQPLETFDAYPSIINMDPPDVNRRRKILSGAFTPRAIAKLEAGIRDRAKTMVDGLYEAGGGDWVTQVASELPMTVIGDIVGIPEADRPVIFRLVENIVKSKSPSSGISPDDEAGFYMEIFQYASALTAEKRRNPVDDIWSALCIAGADGTDDAQYALAQNELEMFFFVLSLAGGDTTRNALTAGLQAFVENPDQAERYRRDEALRSTAVEEVLRWTTPIIYWVRGAKSDVEIDGQIIPAGSRVVAMLASANRDEEVFDNPFAFDIGRINNPHVAFGGGGPHYCLGAMLARAEIRAVFDELFGRDTMFILGDPIATYPNLGLNMYVYEHLPIEFGA
ncbi:cytochrome [Mycobacteriaceae bacterium 1482268.1]|nr:cytochrome [Mycobacteriaceae bacterium 1482268.1]